MNLQVKYRFTYCKIKQHSLTSQLNSKKKKKEKKSGTLSIGDRWSKDSFDTVQRGLTTYQEQSSFQMERIMALVGGRLIGELVPTNCSSSSPRPGHWPRVRAPMLQSPYDTRTKPHNTTIEFNTMTRDLPRHNLHSTHFSNHVSIS